MSQSQSIIVLSSSCGSDEFPSIDTDFSSSSRSASNDPSSSSYLASLPLVCDILMLPERPDETKEALSLSKKWLNPCGLDNVIRVQNLQTGAMLMSLTSCHVVAVANEQTSHPVALPVQPVPSTFFLDWQGETSEVDRESNLSVTFGFETAQKQWNELLKEQQEHAAAAKTRVTHNDKDDIQKAEKPAKYDPNDNVHTGCPPREDSCDINLEPFYQDLIRSSFTKLTKEGSHVSDDPQVVLKHLQMMTEKEAQDLDRILKVLGVVGLFLLGLLWWSGREMFRASRKESFQIKRIQYAIQEMEQDVKRQKARRSLSSPSVVMPKETRSALQPPKSTRRALSFVTLQSKQATGDTPPCDLQTPAPLPQATHDDYICYAPSTAVLPEEEQEPFEVLDLSPVQKIDDDDSTMQLEPQVQLVEEDQEDQGIKSDEESTPVLLLLTTSLSINRKHVAHQERMKTLLASNELDQLEIVDGADPSKKALRDVLFQLSGLRAAYPQLYVSRGSKLRFVGDMEKVQRLHDEGCMTRKYLFDSNYQDWQHLEDIIGSVRDIDQSFSAHNSVLTSSIAGNEDQAYVRFPSLSTSESQSVASVEADSSDKDDEVEASTDSADSHSVSTPNVTPTSNASENGSIIGSGSIVDGHYGGREESIDSAVSAPKANQQPSVPPWEANSITSVGTDSDAINGVVCEEFSIHSAVSVSTPTQPDISAASNPSSSTTRSLSPFAKMAKNWKERKLGRGKSSRPIRSKLQPLALQWNTGTDLLSNETDADGNGKDTPTKLELKSSENLGNRPKLAPIAKLTPTTKLVPQVSTLPGKTDDQEEGEEISLGDRVAAPPSLEVTCSTPESQDTASFIEDYWW